ncbi:MAG: AI-2E family transporter [Lachnospiraceae bacterium]|nr:AI-2E family transporter [Lachnospiraceae bacterium]
MQENKRYKRKKYRRYVVTGFLILALAILFFFFLFRFDQLREGLRHVVSILKPFIYGGVMAYLLRIPCNFFERHLKKVLPRKMKKTAPGMSILLSLILAVLVLYLLISMVVPQMAVSISTIAAALPGAVDSATKWLHAVMADDPMIEGYIQMGIEYVSQKFQSWAESDLLLMLPNMVDGFASTISTVVAEFMNVFIGIIVCIYALGARKQFARQAKAVIYSIFSQKWAERILREASFADRMFTGFFSGKILDSAIIGVLCYIFSLIFGFPNAMLISVIVGVTNIIPYFGPYIGAVPSALLILIVSPVKCLWFLVFIIVLQQFDGNILGPRLLANSTGLSGFWVLFAVTVFNGLFGFVGILVGVPVFAVIYDLVRKLVVFGLKRRDKLEILQENSETE